MSSSGKDQIRGWKEIASYFDRDERTVKRWEKQRALPVRRIPGEGRANVYIVVSEAEAWLAAGNHVADTPQTGPNGSGPASAVRGAGSHASDSRAETSSPGAASRLAVLLQPDPDPDYDWDDEELETSVLASPPDRPATFSQMHVSTFALLLVGAAVLVVAGTMLRGHLSARPGASAQPHASIVRHPPQSNADTLYLQGVYFNEQRTPADLKRALEAFHGAIAIDPRHARAYAGLAMTYLLLREYGTMPEAYAYFKAEVAAQKALALDPNVPEAHASLGFIAFFSSWNPRLATSEFATALQLDPNCVVAHHWYGSMLTHQGLFEQALQHLDAAQRLDPASAAVLASKAYALGLAGRRDEAMDMVQPLVKEDDAVASPHRVVAILSLLPPRDIPRYLSEMRRFAEIRNSQETLTMLDYGAAAFQHGGERAMWTAMLAKEKELHPSADQPTYFMADMESALGFDDEAVREISILARQHDPAVIGIGIDPLLDPLHHNPRFQKIEASIGLVPQA